MNKTRLAVLLFPLMAPLAVWAATPPSNCAIAADPASGVYLPSGCTNSQLVSTSGSTITIDNTVKGSKPSFEVDITGSPATVSIPIYGCKAGGTCVLLDTDTGTSSAIRDPTNFTGGNGLLQTVYDYFKVIPAWTGGTSPTVTVKTTVTTASGGGTSTGGYSLSIQQSGVTVGTINSNSTLNFSGCTVILVGSVYTIGSCGGGLADPGANGIMKRTSLNVTAPAVAGDLTALLGYTPLNPANNLSDVASASTARTNINVLADPGGNGIVKRTAANVTAPALYTDLTALWASGSCAGFLKSDGTCPTSTANPAGSNLDVQINLSGSFGVDTGKFTFDPTTHILSVYGGIALGSAAPTACGSATACLAFNEASTACSPTAGQDCIRFDSVVHGIRASFNGGAEFTLAAVTSVFGRAGAVTAQSGDYTASQVTNAVANNAANTYSGGGLQDFSADVVKLPIGALLTETGNGLIGYDSTANNYHVGVNGADAVVPTTPPSTPVNGHCPTWVKTGSNIQLGDAGAPCGSSTVTVSAISGAQSCPGTGTNTITCSTSGSYTSSNDGDVIELSMGASPSSGAVTLNVNGIATVAVTDTSGNALSSSNTLAAHGHYFCRYYATTPSWQCTGPAGTGSGGGFSQPIVSKSANYSVTNSDFSSSSGFGNLLTNTSSSAITFTLPGSGLPANGGCLAVQNLPTSGLLTINPNGLTISGLTANILMEPGAAGGICTDGSNYYASPSLIGPAESMWTNGISNTASLVTMTASSNITARAFDLPVTILVTTAVFDITTADSGNTYDLMIMNHAGAVIAHRGAGGTGGFNPTATGKFTCALAPANSNTSFSGPQTWLPGRYYVGFAGDGSHTALKVSTATSGAVFPTQFAGNLSGCTATSGVILATSCTVPADSVNTTAANMPGIGFYK